MIPFEREPRRAPDPDRGPGDRAGAQPQFGGRLGGRVAGPSPRREERPARAVAGWLVGPLIACATAGGVLFVLRGPDSVFGIVFALVLALGLGWIVVSVLYPSRADRRCPRCGADALERADRHSLAGVRCRSCAWRDDAASAFLLAEDDGEPFEDIVLRDRAARRRHRRW